MMKAFHSHSDADFSADALCNFVIAYLRIWLMVISPQLKVIEQPSQWWELSTQHLVWGDKWTHAACRIQRIVISVIYLFLKRNHSVKHRLNNDRDSHPAAINQFAVTDCKWFKSKTGWDNRAWPVFSVFYICMRHTE